MDVKSVGTRRAYQTIINDCGLTQIAFQFKNLGLPLRASTVHTLRKDAGKEEFVGDISVIVREHVTLERSTFASHMKALKPIQSKKKTQNGTLCARVAWSNRS